VSAPRLRDFDALTPRGRIGRLRALASDALRAYDIDVVRCSFVATAFNTVFRVDATDGSVYALRMSPKLRIHADGCEAVEAAWTDALRVDAGVATPRVVRARDGSPVVWAERADVPERRSCVVFEWVRGRPLRERITPESVRATGALVAAVHEHGSSYCAEPPAGALVGDRVLCFRAPERLAELHGEYGTMLDEAVDRAQRVLDDLWRRPPHRPHLLHADVQPGNVMVDRGKVTLIDFQDLIWGFEIQDVTLALLEIERSDAAGALGAAFREGYETVRTWPDAEAATVAAIRAARHLNVLNYGLSMRKPGLDAFVARHAAAVANWMGSAG
jgi:Ser/Thr protein kinase RdoA (MazF antagonist)